MLKKILLIVIIMNLFIMTNSLAEVKDFENHWATNEIEKFSENEFIKLENNNFRPDEYMTRGEFVRLVNNVYGYTELSNDFFSDMNMSNEYIKDALIARNIGYISGYPDNTFRSDKNISRQEAATVFYKIMNLEDSSENNLINFADFNELPEWSRNYLNKVVEKGYLAGYPDKTLKPTNNIKRAEAVKMVDNIINNVVRNDKTVEYVEGNMIITTPNVTLENLHITGDLIVSAAVGDGDLTIKNTTVDGMFLVLGGGENSIHLVNSELGKVVVNKRYSKVRIVIDKDSKIIKVFVKSSITIESAGEINEVSLEAESDNTVDLKGKFEKLNIKKNNILNIEEESSFENIDIQVEIELELKKHVFVKNMKIRRNTKLKATEKIEEFEIDSENEEIDVEFEGRITKVIVNDEVGFIIKGRASKIDELEINGKANISGEGKISKAVVNMIGAIIEQTINEVVLLNDATVTVGGKEITEDIEKEIVIAPPFFIPPPSSGGGAPSSGTDPVPSISLTRIVINSLPTKLNYNINDSLDLSGISVVSVYSDGSRENISVTNSMISGFNTSSIGNKSLTINYKGKTTSFSINVQELNNDVQFLITESFFGSPTFDLSIKVNNEIISDFKLLYDNSEITFDKDSDGLVRVLNKYQNANKLKVVKDDVEYIDSNSEFEDLEYIRFLVKESFIGSPTFDLKVKINSQFISDFKLLYDNSEITVDKDNDGIVRVINKYQNVNKLKIIKNNVEYIDSNLEFEILN